MNHLEKFFTRRATWPIIFLLVVLSALMVGLIFPHVAPTAFSPQHRALDLQLWYGAAEVHAHMDGLTASQRQQDAWAHLTWDMLFPLLYGTLLALLLVKAWPQHKAWRLALAVVAADFMENITLAVLYWTHPRYVDVFARVAGFWSAAKWTLTALTLFFIIRGGFDRWTESVITRIEEA